jgi:hypothetical protein
LITIFNPLTSEPAIHLISVGDVDEAEKVGADECIFVAVYYPLAGFATGGGWFIPNKQGNSDLGDLLLGIDRNCLQQTSNRL